MKPLRFFKSQYLVCLVLLVSWGCDTDSDEKVPSYNNGAFVVNEGQFNAGNGSITYYDQSTKEAVQGIDKPSEGEFSGDVMQSITFNGDEAYLVLNGSNKIIVVNGKTFKAKGEIVDVKLDKPRYMEVINGKGYVSVWGSYDESFNLIDSYILVIDLTTLEVIDEIDTDEGVENMLYNGEYLFATNYNFGSSNTLAIIDPTDNSLEDQITLSGGPKELVLDANNKLWVICTGGYSDTEGFLYRIDPTTGEIEDSFELGFKPSGDLAVTPDKNALIFNDGEKVYKMNIMDEEAPEDEFFTVADIISPYGLDVDPTTGDIYITDALNYASVGLVYIYNSEGEFESSFTTGISPTEVAFR